jgi:hypothetical protein
MEFHIQFNDHRTVWLSTLDVPCCCSGVESIVSSGYENDIDRNPRVGAFIDDDDALEDTLDILQVFLVMTTKLSV